jgi:hypothetical protein
VSKDKEDEGKLMHYFELRASDEPQTKVTELRRHVQNAAGCTKTESDRLWERSQLLIAAAAGFLNGARRVIA